MKSAKSKHHARALHLLGDIFEPIIFSNDLSYFLFSLISFTVFIQMIKILKFEMSVFKQNFIGIFPNREANFCQTLLVANIQKNCFITRSAILYLDSISRQFMYTPTYNVYTQIIMHTKWSNKKLTRGDKLFSNQYIFALSYIRYPFNSYATASLYSFFT